MYCRDCGAENSDSAKFCKNCGAPLASGSIKDSVTKSERLNNNVHSENINNVRERSSPNTAQSMGAASNSSSSNKNTLIICITAIICVALVAGAFLMLNSNGSDDSEVLADDADSEVDQSDDDSSSSSSSSTSSSSSSNGMGYDEASSYLSGASNTVIRNTFDEADANNDGVLTGSEISRFKYLADLTDRTADTSNTEHVEASDQGAGDGTTKTRYCTTHGRVAVGSDNLCPYCEAEGLDARTLKGSTEYV